MIKRRFWAELIESRWKERSVLWLAGLRRAGKTTLAETLEKIEIFDCELPRVRQTLEDPEAFLDKVKGKRIVLDEIHRLPNPSEILKIAADHFPTVRILATGSSSLSASAKFKDTLTGRKRDVWLTPMLSKDLVDFQRDDLSHRFLRGGLPPFFISKSYPERDFQDWIDSYWAKDIQELFRLERKASFQKFLELLLLQSGGIFEATRFSTPCEVSRQTIMNYLTVVDSTFVATVIRPYSEHRATEIISAPKVYGFDTGFVCYFKGWNQLRSGDMGFLWEHYVLNEIQGRLQTRQLLYWRDKMGHEIDFIIRPRGEKKPLIAIECKWSVRSWTDDNWAIFIKNYPHANCFVVTHDAKPSFNRTVNGTTVKVVNLEDLILTLQDEVGFRS
jgi:uncharacterized protein